MLRTLSTAALFTLAAAAAQAAPMAPVAQAASINVAYGDLNLSQPQDAAILAERLKVAAHEVCLKTNDATSSIRKILMRRCVDQAVGKATSHIWSEIESSPNRSIRANLMSVRQQVASADMP
jgi:UrcA family protein